MEDAVLLWESILEHIKDNPSTTIGESRKYVIKNLHKKFKRYKNRCPYCQYIYRKKGNVDITSQDCDECIGVKNQAFGCEENVKCFMMGSYFSICCNEPSEKNVAKQLNEFKRILKINEKPRIPTLW